MVRLHKALEASYMPTSQAENYLKNDGYIMDKSLSDINSKVYINPTKNNDVLLLERGSKNFLNDWLLTDIPLMMGGLKYTKRYQDEKKKYDQVRNKYKESRITLAGDSLGGSLASELGQKNDKIVTYNKGSGLGSESVNKKNERAYRELTDLVSLKSMLNINQPHTLVGSVSSLLNPIQAHNINNLENREINI